MPIAIAEKTGSSVEKKAIPVDNYFYAFCFFRIVRGEWLVLIGITSASTLLVLLFAFSMAPIYKSGNAFVSKATPSQLPTRSVRSHKLP